MSRQISSDLFGVLKGARIVGGESVKFQKNEAVRLWRNSSLRSAVSECNVKFPAPVKGPTDVQNLMKEAVQRASMVTHGIKAMVFSSSMEGPETTGGDYLIYDNMVIKPEDIEDMLEESYPHIETSDIHKIIPTGTKSISSNFNEGEKLVSELKSSEKTLEELAASEQPINSIIDEKNTREMLIKVSEVSGRDGKNIGAVETVGMSSFRSEGGSTFITPEKSQVGKTEEPEVISGAVAESSKPVLVKTMKFKQKLSDVAKERKVPSTRLSRVVSFGSLAAGLGLGTMAEVTRRTLGLKTAPSVGTTLDSVFLTPANAERIVNTLCKVRGAALKIGQLLSIQDNNVISPVLQQAFERVRQSADFMPRYQIEGVLKAELGDDWRDKFIEFDLKPFAAASIGQVHQGQLKDGRLVAVKIQYPGVAEGINSDIDNLVSVLNLWNIFPEGMFIDNIVEVAKRELSWEVDYIREAECTKKFKELLKPYPDYYVPEVIDDLSTKHVFTTELIEGIPVDKASEFDAASRKHVCQLIMNLCLKELFQFRYMQTDPNWSNFFYNHDLKKLILLDFGATRGYSKEFIDKYIQIIKAASDGDRQAVLEMSREMKFLTGFESKAMEEAHVDTVMILGEIFSEQSGDFDFGKQDTTLRVTRLVPTILTQRLCPPPEEIYSLHRKLSGVFLLCAKLNVSVACRPLFLEVYEHYNPS